MTGYQLVQYFDDTVGLMWAASDSQIYPELRRMEADGLIRAETIPRGERAEKRLYKITPRGRARLRAWTSESIPYPPMRDVHRLQITYGEFTSLANVRKHLSEHLDYYTWRRNQWVKLLETIRAAQFPLMRARLDKSRPGLRRRIIAFKELALEGQVAHADAEIAWARRGLQMIDELDRAESGDAGPPDDA